MDNPAGCLDLNEYFDRMKSDSSVNFCVIIPTYNNELTLGRVIEEVRAFSDHIIVVNDGSTDSTSLILANFLSEIQLIEFSKNEGKGAALRAGLKKAFELDFDYAITIDSDGQHYADDIPEFVKEVENTPGSLLIGSRNMAHESVPKNSSFGNKFSNFWFWFETGISLNDTQSGYRCYPLKKLNKIKFYTKRFEFEIESIVRASWIGVEIKNVPIKVLYNEERVSHFRPFWDFARISLLNTVLVVIAILYIKPRDLFRRVEKIGVKKFFIENVIKNSDSSAKKAKSIALGVFIGIAPLWGLQTIIVLALAVFLKLNKLIAFGFSNISVPPMIPIIVLGSLKMGHWILGGDQGNIPLESLNTDFEILKSLKEYIIGSLALATLSAVVFGFTGYLFLELKRK